MHGLAVYVKEGLTFARDLSLENFEDSQVLMFLTVFTSLSVLLLFPLSVTFFAFEHGLFSISYNIDEVLWCSINPSANVFVFGDFHVYHKDWLTCLVELTDLVNSIIIFLSDMIVLRWLTFLIRSQTDSLIVLLFWIYFF